MATIKNLVFYLDRPGGSFIPREEPVADPGPGEILVRTLRTSICQSDVVIYRQGLPRIRRWPAIILHEASCRVVAVGAGVTSLNAGDLIGLGCDIPCGDEACIYCGTNGTGDWTSCPRTQATGHEFPGFARQYAILPEWFVRLGPVVRFPEVVTADQACHLEPLACCLEGMTRVNHCVERRVVVLIGAGAQSAYALQCARAMGARRIIVVNRGAARLNRLLQEFGGDDVVGLPWDEHVVENVRQACRPFNEPHFVMVNASAEAAYRLGVRLMGYGTVLDAHAGVKTAAGKPKILHEVDLNNDIHYRLQCLQATHGSNLRSIGLAGSWIAEGRLPQLHRMTRADERFPPERLADAIARAADPDSLKVIVEWD